MYTLTELIKLKYECQKRISMNKRYIINFELEGNDASVLKQENENLYKKIDVYDAEITKRFSNNQKYAEISIISK
jgi:hypothetical protein